MKASPHDFKIGLFVVVATGLFLAAVFVFGASKFFESRIIGETYVPGTVEGLKEGAPVMLRGVPVGEVTRINFTWNTYGVPEPRYVLVEFSVRKDVSLVPPGPDFLRQLREQVEQGLRARIKSQGLVGASVVSLEYLEPTDYPPIEVPWEPRHIYIPSAPGQFTEMMDALSQTMARLQQVDFQALAESLQKDLDTAGKLLTDLDQVNFEGIASNANSLISELRETSSQVRSFVGVTSPADGSDLADLSSEAKDLLAGLQRSVTNWNQMLTTLDTASLNQAIDNVRRASQELDEVLRQFKNYPSGALFGRPPPPATSVRPSRER